MPIFPTGGFQRYESNANLTTEQPNAMATKSTAGDVAETVANTEGKTADAAFKITKLYQESQKSTAELNQRTQAEDLLTNAANDPNYNNLDEYIQKSKKIKDDSLQSLKDPEAVAKANYYEAVTNHQLKGIFQKKVLAHEQANLLGLLDIDSKNGDIQSIKTRISNAQQNGFINEKDAEKLQKQTLENSVANDVANDPSTDVASSHVLAELKKGDSGAYSFLDSKSRSQMVNKSLEQINQNRKFHLDQTIDNRLGILKDFADGKITPQNSQQLINQLTVSDPKLGEAIKAATNSLFTPQDDDEAFSEATQQIFSASNREDIGNYIMNVLSTNANRDISRDRLAILVNAGIERAKGLKSQAVDGTPTQSPAQVGIDSAVKSLVSSNPALSAPNMLINFFRELQNGSSPKEAHDTAIKTEITRTNPLYTKYKIGDVITNSNNVSGEVIGFNDNGSPIIKRKK